MSESPQRARGGPLLFAAAIFAAAFLIFLVQPMVGKRILPWFGGAPAVWTLCLAFYQTTLFLGYAYAHCVIRYVPPGFQLLVHGLVLIAALLVLPVLPSDAWAPAGGSEPSRAILTMLAFHVALPFLALAATGPLVQAWFARRHPHRSPYPLYAVSNAGSLLAMLGYPFLLEPWLPLSATGRLWSVAFAATGVAVLACARLAGSRALGDQRSLVSPGEVAPAPAPGAARVALWFLLSACAVVLLMGVTNQMCLDVASVPFLWTLPLSGYLISFILCFRSDRPTRRAPYLLMAAFPSILPIAIRLLGVGNEGILAVADSVRSQIVLLWMMLFGACMVLHGELHRLRPPPRSLTAFYLCISGGGALGGIFVGLVAPRIFDYYEELQLGLGLGCLLLLCARWHDTRGWLHRTAPKWRWAVATAVTAALLVQWSLAASARLENLMLVERTFFGVLRVQQLGEGANEQRHLLNGSTQHGVQFPGSELQPTSYFGEQTGIGLAFAQRSSSGPSAIGVVGLGIGTLAAYGRPGDRFRFYEIDPAVIRIALDTDYFTYLAKSRAEVEVVEGDARISLAAELEQAGQIGFDLLIIDAFNSDAIPVHLLTREAFELYGKVLAADGMLAVHASNRRLDLAPIVARLGESAGFTVAAISTSALGRYLSAQSVWIFLSRDHGRISALLEFAESRRRQLGLAQDAIETREFSAAEIAGTPLWTDDYSDVFGAMLPIPISFDVGP